MKYLIVILNIIFFSSVMLTGCTQTPESVFTKNNITPWCIVPFDAKERGSKERAEMLQRLGFKTLAYDWRDVHIPAFDEEVSELRKHGIRMTAFWWTGGLPKSTDDIYKSSLGSLQVEFLKRNNLKTDIWVMLINGNYEAFNEQERYKEVARRFDILAKELDTIGCRLSLYNHGGWSGEPSVMVGIMNRIKSKNAGLVYSFHHGHEHLDSMPEAFQMMVPYLTCVNLNGMNMDGPKILPLGEGEEDLRILKMIRDSGYKGSIGILGHVHNEDVEIVLKRNLEGLKSLLAELGEHEALKTY